MRSRLSSKFVLIPLAVIIAGIGFAAAAFAAQLAAPETHVVPYTVAVSDQTVTGELTVTDTNPPVTVTETSPPVTVTETTPPVTVTVTETTPTTTQPVDVCPNIPGVQTEVPAGYEVDENGDCVQTQPPPGNNLILAPNTTWRCTTNVNYDLVKVQITQQLQRQDAVFLSSGCTGHIGRLEIDTWASDGIHIGPFAHDLTIDGGYATVHARCGTPCDPLHADVIQVLGGSNITFNNFAVELQYSEGTNSALYINCGNQCQQRPTNVIFNNSTFRRTPDKNRVVRIGNSISSGITNSTVYWCGTGPTCDAPSADAIWYNGLATNPVPPGNGDWGSNTLVAVGG